MHLHTVYMAYSECLPTRLNPLAERKYFSFPLLRLIFSYLYGGLYGELYERRYNEVLSSHRSGWGPYAIVFGKTPTEAGLVTLA